jgi:hypothetical protein
MSDSLTSIPDAPEIEGLLADFRHPDHLVEAAKDLRDAGYQQLDAFTPFPIHGLDKILRIPASPLPWIVLAAGLIGGGVALLGQWWTNAVDYPFIISGKPLFSLPANIPVTFEVIILSSGFAAFFGMLALNRLPRFHQPLLAHRRFRRATSHHFLLTVAATDPRFSLESARQLLHDAGALSVEVVSRPTSDSSVPRWGYYALGMLATLALVPPLLIARARETTSELPRLHLVKDMDTQPKFKAQTKTSLFADRRAMRPPVAGTVARGELFEDDRMYRGLESDAVLPPPRLAPEATPSTEASAVDGPLLDATNEVEWVRSIPLEVTAERMQRGRERYNIFCATCHGRTGEGMVWYRCGHCNSSRGRGFRLLPCTPITSANNRWDSCFTRSPTEYERCPVMGHRFRWRTGGRSSCTSEPCNAASMPPWPMSPRRSGRHSGI